MTDCSKFIRDSVKSLRDLLLQVIKCRLDEHTRVTGQLEYNLAACEDNVQYAGDDPSDTEYIGRVVPEGVVMGGLLYPRPSEINIVVPWDEVSLDRLMDILETLEAVDKEAADAKQG